MKKVVTLVVTLAIVLCTAFAAAEVKIYDNFEVTGLEISDNESAFMNDGWDVIIVVECDELVNDIKCEKNIIRFTDESYSNYNDVYGLVYDEYGLIAYESAGTIGTDVANCRSKSVSAVVLQLRDYLEKEYPENTFEMYVFENN